MKKNIKKILSLTLMLTLMIAGLLIATPKVSAATAINIEATSNTDQGASEKLNLLFNNTSGYFSDYSLSAGEELFLTETGFRFAGRTLKFSDLPIGDGSFELRIFIIDGKRPVISGQEVFVTNVDDAKPISFFMQYFSAYDETDGDVSDSIIVKTDNYTQNKSVLGTHKVVIAAYDNSGNEAIADIYITVVDITKPVINGNTSIVSIGYGETYNIETFRLSLTVTDNYDTIANSKIIIKTDGYTANKTQLGTYSIIFEVKDNSNNIGTFEKKVKVIDNVKPSFSGPTTIATSNNTILTESDVRAQLTAHDAIDGNISNKITVVEDNYTGKGNKVGSYTITYSVKDNAGNTATHSVTIIRADKIPPVIWIQDGVSIKTTPETPLTFEQIISILQATGQVEVTSQTNFTIEDENYFGNEEEPGVYYMNVEARSLNGNTSRHELTIWVLASSDNGGVTVTPGKTIIDWITNNIFLTTTIVLVFGVGIFLIFRKRK